MEKKWIPKHSCLLACLALWMGACGQVEGSEEGYAEVGGQEASLTGVDIEIDQPLDGTFVEAATVTVKGRVSGMSHKVASVHVNGVVADVIYEGADYFKWSAQVPVSATDIFNPIVAELVVSGADTGDREIVHVIAGGSSDETFPVDKGTILRLNDSGLDKIEAKVAADFDFDVRDYLKVGDEVQLLDFSHFPSAVQELTEQMLDAYVLDASSAGVSVELDAQEGYFEANATLSNVFVRLGLVLFDDYFDTNEIDFSGLGCIVDLSIDEARFLGKFGLMVPDPGSSEPKFVEVANSDSEVQLDDFVWDFTMGVCDLPNAEKVVDAVLSTFFDDLESLLRSQVKDMLSGSAAAATLEKRLNELSLEDEGAPMGVKIHAPVDFTWHDVDGVTVGTALHIAPDPESAECRANTALPNNNSPAIQLRTPAQALDFTESLTVPLDRPELGTTVAESSFDLAVALSPSAINQYLKSKAECGLPEATISGLNLGFPVPLAMTITPTLAPVVTGQVGPANEDLDLRVGGVRFVLYDPTDGTFYADGSISARLGVALSVQSGDIHAVVHSPAVSDVVLQLGETAQPMDDVPWENVLPQIIVPYIPTFQNTFESISLTNDENLETDLVDVATPGGYLTLFMNLATGTCPSAQEFDGGLCYPTCDEGYEGFQRECSEECPEGFVDGGTWCFHDFESNPKKQASRSGTWPICGTYEETIYGLCYPRCNTGYRSEGSYCRKPCPSGYVDDGVTCRKPEVIISQERYYRGSGSSLTCASNEQYQNGLCYPKCKSGYYGSGMYCYEKGCPSGYSDNGPSCYRAPRSIWTCGTCPSGYRDDGCVCTRDARTYWKKKYYRGSGRGVHTCKSGYEKEGLLCYPNCSSGYDGVLSYCWKYCPSGYVDDGATCRKPAVIISQQSYSRTGTVPDSCPSGRYLEDGLCYTRCDAGYTGVGAICYEDCPDGYTDDGLFCRVDEVRYPKDVYEREGTLPVTH